MGMHTSRALGILLTTVMVSLTLSGCLNGYGTEERGASIARELGDMPGVLEVEASFKEPVLGVSPYSAVWISLTGDVTEPQVLDILTTFSGANLAAGTEHVSTSLQMRIETDDVNVTERLELDFAEPNSQLLAGVVRAWFDLRGRYVDTRVGLIKQFLGSNPAGFEVTIDMPEGSTAASELEAIRDVSSVFTDIGRVTQLFMVDGRFKASSGLPSEATIAAAESMVATEGITDLRGQFYGDEIAHLDARMSDPPGPLDPAAGIPSALVQAVDLITGDESAMSVAFQIGDDPNVEWFFRNDSCEQYSELSDDNESRALLLHWARDGRTLLDGSTAASCFS